MSFQIINRILEQFKNNPKQAVIFITFLCLIAAALYLNFILLPQTKEFLSLFSDVSKLTVKIKNMEAGIAAIPSFKKDIDTYRDKVDKYEKMLPAEQEVPALLNSLSSMAQSSNIKIIAITPALNQDKAVRGSKAYHEIPILITAKGGFHELGRFLSGLETSERFMKVADLEIKTNPSNAKVHDIDILILIYTLPSEKIKAE